ncbi:MAG: phosphodiester glycosidase family protein [Clostridia bacterium]|nr:phosphodiester glycosidase family protein [Clostridia bacterium]
MTKCLAVLAAFLFLAVRPPVAAAASDTRVSGDLDGDGAVSAADAAIVLRAALGTGSLDTAGSVLADATGDMAVGRSDATAILLHAVGRIGSFDELTLGGADTLLGDRYLEKFSYQGTVRRGYDYRSHDVSIAVTRFSYAEAVCYLADIYIRHIESFRTAFGGGGYNAGRETVAALASETGALLAVNGDQYLNVAGGPLVRNGVWHRESVAYNTDVCVLYRDGVIETFAAGEADAEALSADGVYQSWVCGPRLLDAEGLPMEKFTCPADFKNCVARTAIGYYEPGHYCLVVVDGTQNPDSEGLKLEALSELFHSLGCRAAYNLYGGVNALMYAGAEAVSTPHAAERSVSDILYIAEPF